MSRTIKLYKVEDVTFVEETINGKTTTISSDVGRKFVEIPNGVKIVPEPEETVLNNFKILISELDDDLGATTPNELHRALRLNKYFKKGGGGVSEKLSSFTVRGTTLGKYNDGDIVPEHDSADERFKDIGTNTIPPTFNLPTVSLNTNPSTSNSREVGETLNLTLSRVYAQNDAGTEIETTYQKNNVDLAENTDTIELTTTNLVYKAVTSYNAGTGTKPDNLGNAVNNTITAGTVTSSTKIFRGYLPIFYGSTSSKNQTGANIRSNLAKRLTNSGNVFNLDTGSTNKIFQLWLPTGISLVSVIDLDALNFDVTASYVSEVITGLDAGNNIISGTLYTMEQSVAYSDNHRHQITIA